MGNPFADLYPEGGTAQDTQASPVPVTSYSLPAATTGGAGDEMYDSDTARGVGIGEVELTPGVVAVNPKVYPHGTIFKDTNNNQVFIAADTHGNKNPNVIDVYTPPSQYSGESGERNLVPIGQIPKSAIPKDATTLRNFLSQYGYVPEGESASESLASVGQAEPKAQATEADNPFADLYPQAKQGQASPSPTPVSADNPFSDLYSKEGKPIGQAQPNIPWYQKAYNSFTQPSPEDVGKKPVGAMEAFGRGMAGSLAATNELLTQAIGVFPYLEDKTAQAFGIDSNLYNKWTEKVHAMGIGKPGEEAAAIKPTEYLTTGGKITMPLGEMAADLPGIIATAGVGTEASAVKALSQAEPTLIQAVKDSIPQIQQGLKAMSIPAAKAGLETQQQAAEQGDSVTQQIAKGLASAVTTDILGAVPLAARSKIANPLLRFMEQGAYGYVTGIPVNEFQKQAQSWISGKPYIPSDFKEMVIQAAPMGLMTGIFGLAHAPEVSGPKIAPSDNPVVNEKQDAIIQGADQQFSQPIQRKEEVAAATAPTVKGEEIPMRPAFEGQAPAPTADLNELYLQQMEHEPGTPEHTAIQAQIDAAKRGEQPPKEEPSAAEEVQPPVSAAGEALVAEPTAEAPAEAQPTQPNAVQVEKTGEVGVRNAPSVGEGVGEKNKPEVAPQQGEAPKEEVKPTTPTIETTGEGQLFGEDALPFNLAGETMAPEPERATVGTDVEQQLPMGEAPAAAPEAPKKSAPIRDILYRFQNGEEDGINTLQELHDAIRDAARKLRNRNLRETAAEIQEAIDYGVDVNEGKDLVERSLATLEREANYLDKPPEKEQSFTYKSRGGRKKYFGFEGDDVMRHVLDHKILDPEEWKRRFKTGQYEGAKGGEYDPYFEGHVDIPDYYYDMIFAKKGKTRGINEVAADIGMSADQLWSYIDQAIKDAKSRRVQEEAYNKSLQEHLDALKAAEKLKKEDPEAYAGAVESQVRDYLIKRLRNEGGYTELPRIVYDALVSVGNSIRKAGQSFADWSKEMVSRLGDGVKGYLRQAWEKNKGKYAPEPSLDAVGEDTKGNVKYKGSFEGAIWSGEIKETQANKRAKQATLPNGQKVLLDLDNAPKAVIDHINENTKKFHPYLSEVKPDGSYDLIQNGKVVDTVTPAVMTNWTQTREDGSTYHPTMFETKKYGSSSDPKYIIDNFIRRNGLELAKGQIKNTIPVNELFGKSAREGLKTISKSENVDPEIRELAKTWSEFPSEYLDSDKIKKITESTSISGGSRGRGSRARRGFGHIGIPIKGSESVSTLFHETGHTLTSDEIDLATPWSGSVRTGKEYNNILEKALSNPNVKEPIKRLIRLYKSTLNQLGLTEKYLGSGDTVGDATNVRFVKRLSGDESWAQFKKISDANKISRILKDAGIKNDIANFKQDDKYVLKAYDNEKLKEFLKNNAQDYSDLPHGTFAKLAYEIKRSAIASEDPDITVSRGGEYGLANLDEFVGRTWEVDPTFRNMLKGLKGDGQMSMWQSFVNTIAKLLKIPTDSMAASIIDNSLEIGALKKTKESEIKKYKEEQGRFKFSPQSPEEAKRRAAVKRLYDIVSQNEGKPGFEKFSDLLARKYPDLKNDPAALRELYSMASGERGGFTYPAKATPTAAPAPKVPTAETPEQISIRRKDQEAQVRSGILTSVVPAGEGMSQSSINERGRQNLSKGADPMGALEKAKTGDLDALMTARAYYEGLQKQKSAILKKYGPESPEYKQISDQAQSYYEGLREAGTTASIALSTFKGQNDLSDAADIATLYRSITGEEPTLAKHDQIRKIADKVDTTIKESDKAIEDHIATVDKGLADVEVETPPTLDDTKQQVADLSDKEGRTQRAEIDRLNSELEQTKADLEELRQAQATGQDAASLREYYEAKVRDLQSQLEQRPKYGKEVFEQARKIVDRWMEEAEAADKRLSKKIRQQLGTFPDVSAIGDLAVIMRGHIGKLGLDFAESSKRLIDKYGPQIQPLLQKAWDKAQELIKGEPGGEKAARTVSSSKGKAKAKPEAKMTPAEKAEESLRKRIAQAQKKIDDINSGKVTTPKEVEKVTNEEIKRLEDVYNKKKQELADARLKAKTRAAFEKGKVSDKLNPEQVKTLWEAAKRFYLDKGESDYDKMISDLSSDFGLTPNQVREAFASPKGAKKTSDELYLKQRNRQMALDEAKRWIDNQKASFIGKVFGTLAEKTFKLAIFGHGTAFIGTHAPQTLYTHPRAAFRAWLKGFSYSFRGKNGQIKNIVENKDLINRPNWVIARKAGLENDPREIRREGATPSRSDSRLGKALDVISGGRGFDALFHLRQDIFDQAWNQLSITQRTPEMAEMLADSINNSTGFTKGGPRTAGILQSPITKVLFFAPKLIASRFKWMIQDPARMLGTFSKMATGLGKVSPEERMSAIYEAKNKAKFLAFVTGSLLANQALLSAVGSNQKINFTDPKKNDWLAYKGFGYNLATIGAFTRIARLIAQEWHALPPHELTRLEKAKGGREALMKDAIYTYLRSGFSPITRDIIVASTGKDYLGNVVPWSSDQPDRGRRKLTWREIVQEQFAPIPISEAATQKEAIPAMAKGAAAAFTGLRLETPTDIEEYEKSLKSRGRGPSGLNLPQMPKLPKMPSF